MSEQKTEPPSQRKIREARKKGNVLKSKEVIAAAGMLTFTLFFVAYIVTVADKVSALFIMDNQILFKDFHFTAKHMMTMGIKVVLWGVLPIVGLMFLSAIVSNMAQIGFLFTATPLTKGMQKLNFINNAKQIFSKKSLFSFAMNIAKVMVITLLLTLVIKNYFASFINAASCGIDCTLHIFFLLILALLSFSTLAYIVIAVLDYLAQRHFYMKDLRMTKQEVKQEYKEDEGDPEVKAKRKQLYQEMLQENVMLSKVRQATVVVKNPSHYAVALFYKENKTPLPMVIGKGEGALATSILRVAREENIPVFENIALAQNLFHGTPINSYIPENLIDAVVEALQYVQKLKAKR